VTVGRSGLSYVIGTQKRGKRFFQLFTGATRGLMSVFHGSLALA
jgi:hypothetical protein